MGSIGATMLSQQINEQADRLVLTVEQSQAVFAVVDVLAAYPRVRRLLTSPGIDYDRRNELVKTIFADQIPEQTRRLVSLMISLNWSSGQKLVHGLEYQGCRALLAAALRSDELDVVRVELASFGRIIQSTPRLADILEDDLSPAEGLVKLIGELVDQKANPITSILLKRAAKNLQSSQYYSRIRKYLALASDLRNRLLATVTSARMLSQEQMEKLKSQLSRIYGNDVDLEIIIDPTVLGGASVEIGDELIDGTVHGRLIAAQQLLDA